jgi:hypothetical protein
MLPSGILKHGTFGDCGRRVISLFVRGVDRQDVAENRLDKGPFI